MLLIMVVAMTVVFVIGAIAVDVGLFLSERRGAQSDADFVALSGAWALLDPAATEADANAAADAALVANDEQLNASIFGTQVDLITRCVSVDVRHDSKPLFFAIFGLGSPDIGAHAKACAGAANAPGNLVPFEMSDNPGDCFEDDEKPKLGAMCGIEMAAQDGNPRGMLDLQAPAPFCSHSPGAGDIVDLIENSAPGFCYINTTGVCDPGNNGPWHDCVAAQDGNPKKVIDGVYARVSADGDCDSTASPTNLDGVDDFLETVKLVFGSGSSGIYAPIDCSTADGMQMSPRLISLIILEEPPLAGNTGYPIKAIASFYLAGCANESVVVVDEDDLVDRYCGPSFPEPGHAVVYGRFVNIIYANTPGGIGVPTDQTTAFAIALVE